ncbi:MAG: biotin/lipoyl-containing protein [Bacillota bacterium]|nr:biotin/lipoyl-containing protein [Bacillota bacterium]
MKYVVTLNDKKYEVVVEKGEAVIDNVSNAASQPVATAPAPVVQSAAPAPVSTPAAPVSGGERIDSPMPGTILDIKVTAGQSVKKGQPLLVLEAMKMENDIVSPRDAVVSQVLTTKAASVSTGDPLVILS